MGLRHLIWRGACLAGFFCLTGCEAARVDTQETEAIDYELLEEADIPEEMSEPLMERRESPFLFTWADQGALYIARGYGRQETGGYEIQVTELCESKNAIILKTTLLGPEPDEEEEGPSCPYIVIRTAYSDKYVMTE